MPVPLDETGFGTAYGHPWAMPRAAFIMFILSIHVKSSAGAARQMNTWRATPTAAFPSLLSVSGYD